LPNIVNYNVVPNKQNPNHWVNASSFAHPSSAYTLGNAPQRMTQFCDREQRDVELSVGKNLGN
jgi:hypothetical protein